MKKAIALLLALVMVFALCACGGGDKGTADNGEKVVKIGVFEPASGDSGAGGKKEMLGMQYANQETPTVEIGGETYKVELVYSDNGSDSAKAVSAASKLVNEKVSLVLGSYGSGVSIAASDTFKQAFEKAGGTVVTDSFPKDNSDFSSYLNKAKDQGCDVFFAPVSIAYSTQLVSQAASLNIGIPFLGSDTWDDNMVLQAAKGTNVQVFVSTFYAEGGNKTFDDGIKAYINGNADAKTTNGGDDTISAVTAMGYDVYYVALEALKAAGSTDPAKVMEALPGVTYDGVSGHIAFDETGDAIRDTAYIKTIDTAANVWKFVTQQKAS